MWTNDDLKRLTVIIEVVYSVLWLCRLRLVTCNQTTFKVGPKYAVKHSGISKSLASCSRHVGPNILKQYNKCMLPTATMAWSSSGGVEICYVLPVLWTTSCLHMTRNWQCEKAYTQNVSTGGSGIWHQDEYSNWQGAALDSDLGGVWYLQLSCRIIITSLMLQCVCCPSL